jgi:hypothetical protein
MRKEYNPIEVSYGVDIEQTPSLEEAKTEQVKVEQSIGKQEPTPSKPKGILEEIEEMKSKGLTRTPEFKEKMQKLESILGVSEISPYGTNELDIFEDKLKEMTLSDMQKLASKVGLNPFLDRPTLKKVLIKEFSAYNRNNRRNIMPSPVNTFKLDPNNPKHQEVKKILGD